MSDIKFTVSNGQWTISYEGSEEFLNEKLIVTVQTLLNSGLFNGTNQVFDTQTDEQHSNTIDETGTTTQFPQMTMNSLCAKLNCKTGAELVIAACVYMTFITGQDMLPRRDIVQNMKTATRYYKDTYASNLSSYLGTLVKQGRLMERTQEIYVMSPGFAREMEKALA